MKKFIEYLRYSGVWIGIVLNPFQWQPKIETKDSLFNDMNPNGKLLYISLGPLWIRIVIDDATY
jgi:hypothetical protein